MMLQEALLGNRIVRLSDGKIIGSVTRVYLDENRQALEKIGFGDNRVIRRHEIVFLGEDVVLIHREKTTATPQKPVEEGAEQSGMLYAADRSTSKEATGTNWWVAVH